MNPGGCRSNVLGFELAILVLFAKALIGTVLLPVWISRSTLGPMDIPVELNDFFHGLLCPRTPYMAQHEHHEKLVSSIPVFCSAHGPSDRSRAATLFWTAHHQDEAEPWQFSEGLHNYNNLRLSILICLCLHPQQNIYSVSQWTSINPHMAEYC